MPTRNSPAGSLPVLESVEPRILLSAAPAPGLLYAADLAGNFTPADLEATAHTGGGPAAATPAKPRHGGARVGPAAAAGRSVPGTTTPPAGPLGLSAAAASDTVIDLTWNPSAGAGSYVVAISTDGVTFADLATIAAAGAGAQSYAATGLAPATAYNFRVSAVGAGGRSAPGNVASATTAADAPTGAAAAADSATQITVTWNFVTGATGYAVERSADGVAGWASVGTAAAGTTAFPDAGVSPGTAYFYRVLSADAGGPSQPSNTAAATTLTDAPTSLAARAASASRINLTWNDVTGETGFVVERSPDGSTGWARVGTTAAGTTVFYNAGLTASTGYSYRVKAVGASGVSAASGVATATTSATIPAYAADDVVYGLANAGTVYAIDSTAATATPIGNMLFATAACGRDPVRGKFYYVEQTSGTARVAVWDPATNTNTNLGTYTFSGSVLRAAFSADGTSYVTAGNGDLYTVNLTTGAPTLLGTIHAGGSQLPASSGDMAFAPDGTLYLEAGGPLYRVNIGSLTATLLGNDGAVGSLQVAFGQNGVLYGTVSGGSLYSVNLTSGAATLVGSTGVSGIGDLASVPLNSDLSVSQTASALVKGANGTYTLQVANAGPNVVVGPVTLTDTLPAGLTYVSAAGAGWSFKVSGQIVTLSYGAPVTAGATLPPVTVTVAVGSSAPASVSNTVTVSSSVFDQVMANNSSSLTTGVS